MVTSCCSASDSRRSGAKRGLPAYLYRRSTSGEPVVLLVADPRHDAACVAAAGRIVAKGAADIAVIAGVSRPSDPWLETGAHSAARLLAEGGLLVTLSSDGGEHAAPKPAAPDVASRADLLLPQIRASLGDDGGSGRRLTTAVVDGRELHLTLDAVGWARAMAPPTERVELDTATAMAIALEDVRASTVRVDVEHLVALRRLLLEPLLGPTDDAAEPDAARALAPFAAAMLGYTLTAPTRGPNGDEVVALIPHERGLPIALVTRTSGVRARVVEAPLAARRGVRDLALRLDVALDADAVVLGEAWKGGMRFGAAREAQAAVTDRALPEIFYVRGDEADTTDTGAELSAWMDDGHASADADAALTALGVTVERRDLGARTARGRDADPPARLPARVHHRGPAGATANLPRRGSPGHAALRVRGAARPRRTPDRRRARGGPCPRQRRPPRLHRLCRGRPPRGHGGERRRGAPARTLAHGTRGERDPRARGGRDVLRGGSARPWGSTARLRLRRAGHRVGAGSPPVGELPRGARAPWRLLRGCSVSGVQSHASATAELVLEPQVRKFSDRRWIVGALAIPALLLAAYLAVLRLSSLEQMLVADAAHASRAVLYELPRGSALAAPIEPGTEIIRLAMHAYVHDAELPLGKRRTKLHVVEEGSRGRKVEDVNVDLPGERTRVTSDEPGPSIGDPVAIDFDVHDPAPAS